MRIISVRIGLKPRLKGLVRLLQISRHLPVVDPVDKEPLAFSNSTAESPGLRSDLRGQRRLAHYAVGSPQTRLSHREVRVNFDRSKEQGNCHLRSGGG